MPRGRQLALFGTGAGKGQLLGSELLRRHLDRHHSTPVADVEARTERLKAWVQRSGESRAGERTLDPSFIGDVLCGVLGYARHPASPASLYEKPSSRVTGIKGEPDAVLGEFVGERCQVTAVIELKPPGTDLERPQPGHRYQTPIEQAFAYGQQTPGVLWVLVSDMRVIRLYAIESPWEYEEFDLAKCVPPTVGAADSFRRLHFLLHQRYLVEGGPDSEVARLHSKSIARQLEMRDGFYRAYYRIRAELFRAISRASRALEPKPGREDLLEATQRLLDRMLFIYYCEDHPQELIQDGTVERLTSAARGLPGPDPAKVYGNLKMLFGEVNAGSPPASPLALFGYNGELFKDHWVIDHIDLPDTLHDREYEADNGKSGSRIIRGVWGLHVYDFWTELTEHALGHIFEESLSDLEDLGRSDERPLAEKLRERKRGGIFYTTSILSDFLAASSLDALLEEVAPLPEDGPEELRSALLRRQERLAELKVVDFACGSGAFVVSAYDQIIGELGRIGSLLGDLSGPATDLLGLARGFDVATVARDCLYGVDILPQAVEIAKLSLWLKCARKREKVVDLSANLVAADSLEVDGVFERLGVGAGQFDLVIGNPPWGGEVEPATYEGAVGALDVEDGQRRDSWELFLLLALRALREGGRLALLLPDSFFYPEKARTRAALFASAHVEKVYHLGVDWFGSKVRMGTVFVQARRGPVAADDPMLGLLLAGDVRREAIRGRVTLPQVEAALRRELPIGRTLGSPSHDVEVFRGKEDDRIIERMMERSIRLADLCERTRGEEINKAGLVWECPSCQLLNTPGTKRKGGGYDPTTCDRCGHPLPESSVRTTMLVQSERPPGEESVPFIDGDDLRERYERVVPNKWLRCLPGWPHYKPARQYRPPKILLRQAGVGVFATVDRTASRCPQSVYIYRLRDAHAGVGYTLEYVLGALLSRAMTYLVLKRFAEADPAKAFAKLTHERLAGLPIPRVDFHDREQRRIHAAITAAVRRMLRSAAPSGGSEDWAVELALRSLWGLSASDGEYINGEFAYIPEGQAVRALFPDGPPRPAPSGIDGAGA